MHTLLLKTTVEKREGFDIGLSNNYITKSQPIYELFSQRTWPGKQS